MRKPYFFAAMILLFGLLVGRQSLAAKTAMVTIDGAMVYKDATFDAPVIAYLKRGKKITVSNKTYGPFFKVKLRPGLIGYISDIDIKVESGGGSSAAEDEDDDDGGDDAPPKNNNDKPRDIPTKNSRGSRTYDKPIFATRFVGLTGGVINFKEEVLSQKPSSNLTVYGVKLTGPNLLFTGPYLFDINAIVSLQPPKFYNVFVDAGTKPTGMLFLIDATLLFPIATGFNQDWMVYIGAGPLVVYSKFAVTILGQNLDLQEIKLGGSFVGGLGYRFGKYAIKLDGKYYVEKASYFGVLAGVQKEF